MNRNIQFFTEDVDFILKKKTLLREWVCEVILLQKKKPWYINFIFCSDKYLLELNKSFLKHDTYTDVITFPDTDNPEKVSGDIFISVERVSENALEFGNEFEQEVHRVMIHGVLHLIGYDDKSNEEKLNMTNLEDQYLARL